MELNIEQESQDNVRDLKSAETNNGNGTDSNKCSEAGTFRKHVQKPNKCNQCDYASSNAGTLNRHQCNHDAFTANNLREHLKTHS